MMESGSSALRHPLQKLHGSSRGLDVCATEVKNDRLGDDGTLRSV